MASKHRMISALLFVCLIRFSIHIYLPSGALPRIIAHRGASGYAPENTLAAVDTALALDAAVIEVDIHQTRDNVLVVLHDRTINRTTDGSGKIKDLTFEEIRQYSAGRWFGDPFANERIPSLVEVIERVKGRAMLLIELKGNHSIYPGMERRLVDLLRVHEIEDECILQSFNRTALMNLHVIDSTLTLHRCILFDLPVLHLVLDRTARFRPLEDDRFIRGVSVNRHFVTERFVRRMHGLGKTVHVWTVNKTADFERLAKLKVDGIITDYPDGYGMAGTSSRAIEHRIFESVRIHQAIPRLTF